MSALERAKAIAAKLQAQNGGANANTNASSDTNREDEGRGGEGEGDAGGKRKRSFEGDGAGEGPGGKKIASEEKSLDSTIHEIAAQVAWGGNSNDGGGGGGQFGTGNSGGNQSCAETIMVPCSVIGYVIGRGGESIKNIQSVTGCHVQVEREQDMERGSDCRKVTFESSDIQTVAMAKSMVEKMVRERTGGGFGGREGGAGGTSRVDKVRAAIGAGHSSIKVKIPDCDVGLIIGKGGATIRSIQERTGGNIQIPTSADIDDPSVRTCVITHPNREGCNETKTLMEDVLLKKSDSQRGTRDAVVGGLTVQMQVPDKDVGMIIGRGGCIIKEIQRRTQARFQIPPTADPGTQQRSCTITGTEESTKQVMDIVNRIISEQSTSFFLQKQPVSGWSGGMQHLPQGNVGYYGHVPQQGAYPGVPQGGSLQQPSYYGGVQQQQHQAAGGHAYAPAAAQTQAVGTGQNQVKDYSKEWAEYYAAQAKQQQQQQATMVQGASGGVAAVSEVAAPAAAQAAAANVVGATPGSSLTDPTAYYDAFWKYSDYYGEEAARKYYGAWSPPVGSVRATGGK